MLISLEWLSDLVDIAGLKPEEIAEALTMSGLEVEEVEYLRPKFTKTFTAKIMEINPHPDASKIRLATVDYGHGTQQVVCGAQNIEVNQIIAFATEGASVFSRKDNAEFTLKKVKIRGVESSGMICSASELCLEGPEYEPFSEGIIVFSEMDRFKNTEIKLGIPVEELLDLPVDTVLHSAPTANRGDLMSMRGIANEIAAIFNRKTKMPVIDVDTNYLNADEKFEVEIIDYDTSKYYALGILKEVKIKQSPSWMAKRLEASGMRPINNIVDITNYVMLETGQPLHAFDYNRLPDKYLCVRRAKDNEIIKTLDGMDRKLITDNVVIATRDKAVALAGVMGDETSEINDNTYNLAIESAYFTPAPNRRSSRAVGLRTEACARFERGVDIKTVSVALKRTMQLLVELAEAKTAGIFETGSIDPDPLHVELRFNQVKRVLGIEIPREKCIEILKNLDFVLINNNNETAKFEVPSYRTEDVYREIDLIEEISRIYGYDKIEETIPKRTHLPAQPEENILTDQIKKIFQGAGLTEIITSSLVGYPLLNWASMPPEEKSVVKVTNPQSDEYTMLRQAMTPSILQVVKYNIDRDMKDIWVFEIGKTYHIVGEATEKDPGTKEKLMLAGAITGDTQAGSWHTKLKVDFYVLKGLIENLFETLGIAKRIEMTPAVDINHLHPGRSAYISVLGKKKKSPEDNPYIGFIGQLHPELVSKCKMGQEVFIFEINLNELINCLPNTTARYKKIAQHPAVLRDMAFIINEDISYFEVSKTIKKASSNLLKSSEIFDVYKGQNIPEGQKSFAIRLKLQDQSSTLTDEVVEAEVEKIRAALKKEYDVTLR